MDLVSGLQNRIAACLAILSMSAGAQNWVPQNPVPTSNSCFGIAAADAKTAFVVGTLGFIGKTADGGASWATQPSGVRDSLWAVAALDAKRVYVAGQGGLLATTDGGAHWTHPYGGPKHAFRAIAVKGPGIVYAAGDSGALLRSLDAGSTWTVLNPGTTETLTAIAMVDANIVFVVGAGGTILKSVDAGASWAPHASGLRGLETIAAANKDTVFAGGFWGFLKSVDGGASWTNIRFKFPYTLTCLAAIDGQTVIAGMSPTGAGTKFGAVKTRDGGETWEEVLDAPAEIISISVVDRNVAYALGGHYFLYRAPLLYKTADGGGNWASVMQGVTHDLWSVSAVNAQVAFAAGYGGTLLRTIDGGATWTRGESLFYRYFNSVSAVDARTAYAVGDSGMIATTKDGTTWVRRTSGTVEYLNGVSAPSAEIAYVVGSKGSVLKTIDGGVTWIPQLTITQSFLRAVDTYGPDCAVAIGTDGVILSTRNGGADWKMQYISGLGSSSMRSVSVVDTDIYYVSGENGLFLKTFDGGLNWRKTGPDTGRQIDSSNISISAVSADTLFMVTIKSQVPGILKSVDQGVTWVSQILTNSLPLLGISMVNGNTGYAVGYGGLILGGSGQAPVRTVHPQTRIGGVPMLQTRNGRLVFTLNEAEWVSFRIFDAKGALVSEMPRSRLQAGRHSLPLPAWVRGEYLIDAWIGRKRQYFEAE